MDQVTTGWEESTHKHCLPNRLFLSTIFSKIWLIIGPFFAVLPITLSFLVCFRPVKYQIEALDVIYPMVRRWLTKFSFWSGQHPGQPWLNLVKDGQTSPNFGKCTPGPVSRFLLMWWALFGLDRLGQTSVKLVDTRETPGGKNRVMTGWVVLKLVYHVIS